MMKNKNTGFTLIELLVVVVIIGILSGIGVSQFKGQIQKAAYIKSVAFESLLKRKMLTSLDSYVAFWDFNEDSGSILFDGSAQGNDLTIPPNVSRSFEVSKYKTDANSLEMNGSAPGIQVDGNTLLPKNKITISLWFKLKTHKNYNQLFRYVDSRILIRVANNRQLCFNMTANSGRQDTCFDEDIELDTWYHVGAVYDGVDMILYVNGIEVNRVANENQILNPTDDTSMWLGVGSNTGISVLNGFLDNVYVWGDSFDWD